MECKVIFNTTDNLSGIDNYQLWIDGKPYGIQSSPYPIPQSIPDGVHTVVVRAYDKACNTAENKVKVYIDRVPPEPFNLTVIPPGWAKDDPIIEFSATDNTSGIDYYEVRVDKGPFNRQTSPVTLDDLIEGSHDVTVRAYDMAGNIRDASLTLGFDETPPMDLAITVAPSGWTNQDPTVSFSAVDYITDIDHYELSLDNGPFKNESSPLFLSNLIDGTHTVIVRAYDLAGNRAEGSVQILIDKTPPTEPTITSNPPNWSAYDPVVSFSSVDSVSGIDCYKIMSDDGTFTKAKSPATLSNLPDGEHIVTVRAFDLAGNSIDGCIAVRIDRTPPGPVILHINEGQEATAKRTVSLVITAPDIVSGPDKMSFSEDGTSYSAWEPFASNKTWKLTSSSGDKTIYVKVRDAAGNEARPASATISYEPPKAGFSVPAAVPPIVGLIIAVLAGISIWRWSKKRKKENKHP